MSKHIVLLKSTVRQYRGHLGIKKEVEYEIFLNDVLLRKISTHGDMSNGYFGTSAKSSAEAYAASVAATLGVEVSREEWEPQITSQLVRKS